jgi:type IV pilus assembly protein PilA
MLKKLRKMLKKQEGFTLVELMIVVVILGILAGIGVQQYANVQERAKKAADEANRKVLTNATHMWLILESPTLIEGDNPVDPDVLVGQYLDEWPDYPLNEKETYTVTVETTKDPTTDDLQYSIKVGTETKPDEPGESE